MDVVIFFASLKPVENGGIVFIEPEKGSIFSNGAAEAATFVSKSKLEDSPDIKY